MHWVSSVQLYGLGRLVLQGDIYIEGRAGTAEKEVSNVRWPSFIPQPDVLCIVWVVAGHLHRDRGRISEPHRTDVDYNVTIAISGTGTTKRGIISGLCAAAIVYNVLYALSDVLAMKCKYESPLVVGMLFLTIWKKRR